MGGRTHTTHLIPPAFTKPATCGLFFARLFKSETCPGPPPGHYAKRTARREPRCRTVEPGPWTALPGDRFPDRGPRARSPEPTKKTCQSAQPGPRTARRASRNMGRASRKLSRVPRTIEAIPGDRTGSPGAKIAIFSKLLQNAYRCRFHTNNRVPKQMPLTE